MAKRLPERKLNPWGPTMYVMQGEQQGRSFYYDSEFEMIVAVRLNLVPVGVEILGASNGWAWINLEKPAGFHRPDSQGPAPAELADPEGMPSDEDG
jgi:hypothetical protein